MTKKIVKLAVIRKNSEQPCPFGLPIPFGCEHAGNTITKMASFSSNDEFSDSDKEQIAEANTRLLAWNLEHSAEESCKCPYAATIMEKHDAVECNYEDTAPGVGQSNIVGPPFYSQVFMTTALNGLYSLPIGYYGDYSASRNLFFGIYSLQGSPVMDNLLKKIAEITNNSTTTKHE